MFSNIWTSLCYKKNSFQISNCVPWFLVCCCRRVWCSGKGLIVPTVILVKYLYSAIKSFILLVELIVSLIVFQCTHCYSVWPLGVNPSDSFLHVKIFLLLESSQLDTELQLHCHKGRIERKYPFSWTVGYALGWISLMQELTVDSASACCQARSLCACLKMCFLYSQSTGCTFGRGNLTQMQDSGYPFIELCELYVHFFSLSKFLWKTALRYSTLTASLSLVLSANFKASLMLNCERVCSTIA